MMSCLVVCACDDDDDGNHSHSVHFRRAHSRRRRFVAPGARWDLWFGGEVLYPHLQVRFDLISRYEFDYLFGGNAALAAAIAAANAAALAEQETEAAVLATQGRRKRRKRDDQQEEEEEESVCVNMIHVY